MSDNDVRQSGRSGPPAYSGWLVHAFTASGAMLAFFALMAIERADWPLALLCLFLALVVDGIDGTFARWARVEETAKHVDGDTLDLVVDYLTYVFVPAVFIWRAGLIPESAALPLVAAIQFSSLYLFARTDMKTSDNYFRGFPALWNLVAFYLFALNLGPAAGAIIVCLFAALTFAPVHFIHPFRVRDYGHWPSVISVMWIASSGALLWLSVPGASRTVSLVFSIVTASILLGMGLLRTMRGAREA